MHEASPAREARQHTLVVLLAPELLNTQTDPDRHPVEATLLRTGRLVRVLMRINSEAQFEFAGKLRRAGVDLEILVGAWVGLPPQDADLPYIVMPHGAKTGEPNKVTDEEKRQLDEFALALSDVLLADATNLGEDLVRQARGLAHL